MRWVLALVVCAFFAGVGVALANDASTYYGAQDRKEVYKVVRLDSSEGIMVLTLYEDGTGKWRME